ncbi:MAG: hypothetical protein R2839_03495 [Thermomicrobiales bacterium]
MQESLIFGDDLDRAHDAGDELGAVLIDPILPHLAGVTRLFLSPSGRLLSIPFEAVRTLTTDGKRGTR